ncbi:MAG: hypothetical protein V1729_01815 [Candidatus Woesearchaeota archaeon]
MRKSKKGMEAMQVVVAAAILIAILLIGFYFLNKGAKAASGAADCMNVCSAKDPSGNCPPEYPIKAFQTCQVDGKSGRCCVESPV